MEEVSHEDEDDAAGAVEGDDDTGRGDVLHDTPPPLCRPLSDHHVRRSTLEY